MNVVFDGKELVSGDIVGLEVGVEIVFGVLDEVGAVVVVVYLSVSHTIH